MAKNTATATVEDTDVEDTDVENTDVEDTDVEATDVDNDGESTDKRKTRTPMPFGRPFGLTVKFHNDMAPDKRASIVDGILAVINNAADGETLDTHRSTRGDPNENLQTWLIAPYGYDWPESASKERGVRIPQGKLAEALRRFAAKNDVSMDKAVELFAESFGIGVDEADKA